MNYLKMVITNYQYLEIKSESKENGSGSFNFDRNRDYMEHIYNSQIPEYAKNNLKIFECDKQSRLPKNLKKNTYSHPSFIHNLTDLDKYGQQFGYSCDDDAVYQKEGKFVIKNLEKTFIRKFNRLNNRPRGKEIKREKMKQDIVNILKIVGIVVMIYVDINV